MTIAVQAATQTIRLQGGGLRFLDTQPDHRVVTRAYQGFDGTQSWRVIDMGDGTSTIEHVGSGRFLDALDDEESGFRVVTRPRGDNAAQRWRIEDFGRGFIAIEQVSSGRFLEPTLHGDFDVVTRPLGSSEQTWRVGAP